MNPRGAITNGPWPTSRHTSRMGSSSSKARKESDAKAYVTPPAPDETSSAFGKNASTPRRASDVDASVARATHRLRARAGADDGERRPLRHARDGAGPLRRRTQSAEERALRARVALEAQVEFSRGRLAGRARAGAEPTCHVTGAARIYVVRPETRAADPATPRRPRSPPSVLVDSRLAQFREMGFDAAAAEAALAAANNDVDAALTALLAAKAD